MKKTYVKIKHSEQVTFTVLVKQIKKTKTEYRSIPDLL